MASRFGRNKRRQARERIAELEHQQHLLAVELDAMRGRATMAEARSAEARSEGMNLALQKMGLIREFEGKVRDKLVDAMEPVLRKAAAQVLDAMVSTNRTRHGRERFTDLDMRLQLGAGRLQGESAVLHGHIPQTEWNVVVW